MKSPLPRRSLSTVLFTMLFLVACATTARHEPPPESRYVDPAYGALRDQAARKIEALLEKEAIPGLSIALVERRRGIVWKEGFGFADRERKVPATPETIYRTGSLAKLFTATAILQLAESGRLDIDAPLPALLPEFSIRSRFEAAPAITPRALLSHHAGLPCDLSQGMWSDAHFSTVVQRLRDEYTAFPPGLITSYSNIGYSLLGSVVERTSGQPYAQYVTREVLYPLGMLDSSFELRPAQQARLAAGYRDGARGDPLPIRDKPAMSFYSSVEDFGRFIAAVLDGGDTVLQPGTFRTMVSAQNEQVPFDFARRVGLGWFLDEGGLGGVGTVLRHGGTTPLFTSQLIVLPESDLGVIVLCNSGNGRKTVQYVGEMVLKLALEGQGRTRRVLTAAPPAPPGEAIAMEAGDYATDFGLVSIDPARGEFCATTLGRTLKLVSRTDGWFGLEGKPPAAGGADPLAPLLNVHINCREVGGREVIVARIGDRYHLFGERVQRQPLDEVWCRRAGKYTILNQDAEFPVEKFALVHKGGELYLDYVMPRLSAGLIRTPLTPLSRDEAVVSGLGRGRGDTARFTLENGEEVLNFSGYRAQRVN